jgi:hypothetical protein
LDKKEKKHEKEEKRNKPRIALVKYQQSGRKMNLSSKL